MYNNSCGTSIDNQNKPLGALYICHGLFYLPFYIPCLVAIATKPLNTTPCYQIMTSMGVLDLINLTIGALICGYWSVIGFSYCGNLQFMKVFGAFTNAKTKPVTHTAQIRSFYDFRISYFFLVYFPIEAHGLLLETGLLFFQKRLGGMVCLLWPLHHIGGQSFVRNGNFEQLQSLFANGKVRYWLLACLCYGAAGVILYLTPFATLLYNSGIGVYMFDPINNNMIGIIVNSVNNMGTAVILSILYSMIAVRTKRVAGTIENNQGTPEELSVLKTKRTITTQCWCICLAAGVTCFSYTIVPLITNKIWAFQLTTLFWQMTQGINGIIYLTLNKTIRQRVQVILKISGSVAPSPVSKTTNKAVKIVHHDNAVLEEDL